MAKGIVAPPRNEDDWVELVEEILRIIIKF